MSNPHTQGKDDEERGSGPPSSSNLPAPESHGERLRAWETAPDQLSDLTLMGILNDPSIRESLDDDDDSRQQIRLREALPGFRAMMGKLADELFISYSALCRATLGHGTAILEVQPWIGHLRSAYEHLRREGMDRGDPDALSRLNQTVHYNFQQSRPASTTMDVSRATAARISDLAMVCGISRPKLAVIAVAVSLLTLRNNRGYRKLLQAEVDALERYVIRRTREFRLEDRP